MNIFELLGVIAINNKGANKSIDETGRKAHGLHSKMSQAFASISKGAVACGKFVAKGMTVIGAAGAAATAALLKSSIGAYAEFEQLEGGVKKLFGDDAAKTVMENASKAFKTAGLSANEYMQTVTSFSASLINSLGNDTAAAAELSDIAIQDMSDNANTFGTDITMIQNAYQGFAKQNYTMLDNLKLGYGGTQAEMARLINDSGVMGENFIATAENVNSVSFAKIIEAIHVVQSNMNIAGTTANEASDTIEGSFNMWKASWQNLMTGMGDDENIDPLVDSFFDAGNTVLQNLAKILPRIGANLKAALVSAGEHIKVAWEQNIWPAIQGFFKTKFGIELPDWETVATSISTLWENIKSGIAGFFSTTFTVGTEDDTGEAIGQKIRDWWDSALGFIGNIFHAIFSVNPEDEDGKSVADRIVEWWGKALAFIGDIFCGFFRIDTEDTDGKTVGERITEWWNAVMEFVGDIFNVVFEVRLPNGKTLGQTIQDWWDGVTETVDLTMGITPAINVGQAVTQATGNPNLGMHAEQNAITFTQNPDSNYNAVGIWEGIKSLFGGFATGLDYVPYNDFPARLHVGEAVLTREDASAWRRGKSEEVTVLANRLESAMNRLESIMQQVAANTAAGHTIALDSGVLVGQIAPKMDAQLGTMTARKGRRG